MELTGKPREDEPEPCGEPPRKGPALSWIPLEGIAAAPEGSAYAEFWLSAPGAGDQQRALAGVVAHIGPVIEKLAGGRPGKPDRPADDDSAAAAK